MLAKAADGLPTDDGWLFEPKWDGFRALVFRDGDEVYTQSPRPQAARPLLPGAGGRRCAPASPSAASSTARSSSPRDGGARLRGAPAADPPRRVAGRRCSPRSRRRRSSPGTCSRSATRTCARVPQGERRARLETVLDGRQAAGPPDPGDHATARLAADWFDALRGRRARRRDRQAARRAVPARQAGDAQDQAPAHGRLRRRRVPLAQERAGHARRLAAARAVRRRGHAPPRRRHVVVHVGPAGRARRTSSRRCARTRSTASVGRAGRSGPAERAERRASGCRARRRAGTAARTCRGSRSGRSASPRSPTTTSRAIGSATATTFKRWRPDKPPEACRYDQLEETAPFELAEIFGASR